MKSHTKHMIRCVRECKIMYGAIHLVTTTFGQWLCNGEKVIEKLFEFYTPQNS